MRPTSTGGWSIRYSPAVRSSRPTWPMRRKSHASTPRLRRPPASRPPALALSLSSSVHRFRSFQQGAILLLGSRVPWVRSTDMKWTFASACSLVILTGLAAVRHTKADEPQRNQLFFADATGVQQTITTADSFDFDNPFFQDLGTNGRTCFTCHRPDEAWTVTPDRIQERFLMTRGLDPIFRNNDGSNCENADISTLGQRRAAFSLLLSKGLIRIGIDVPGNAEFTIEDVDDPYNCGAPTTKASLYRRPLPSTNLGFLSTVMWDGRETVKGQAIVDDLATQANDATTGHAQGAPVSLMQATDIVKFETGLFTAQAFDYGAGSLRGNGASGGADALS